MARYSVPRTKRYPYLIAHMNDGCCAPWPFGSTTNGRVEVYKDGVVIEGHRVVCELVNGAPPSLKHQAIHSCGKGHLGCFNASCLRWGTVLENMRDKKIHGTERRGELHPQAKLTQAEVNRIRQLRYLRHTDLADEYGVSRPTISNILAYRYWI